MSGEMLKWADEAMYTSQPMATRRPVVTVVSANADPLGDLASMWAMYAGREEPDLSKITDEAREEAFQEVMKTRLRAPLEAIKFHFLVSGVTRAFTHQLVRQRTAVYAQESLRFAVVEDSFSDRVAIPPSIMALPVSDERYAVWLKTVKAIEDGYKYLVGNGIPAEDARGLLPTNILTRVHWITDLRNLVEVMGNRLCTQAQFEWRAVAVALVGAIRAVHTNSLHNANGFERVYMAGTIADVFRPICYLTGKCEFKANLDRHCKIRERVDEFEKAGIPSSKWGEIRMQGTRPDENWKPQSFDYPPIKTEEWLTDPSAAIKRPSERGAE